MSKDHQSQFKLSHILLITLGVAIYTFGFVKFNMANHLAEGGLAGVTLIFYNLFGFDPAYTSFFFNLPLFIIGARVFGRKSLMLTIYGTVTMSLFIWIWQKVPLVIDLKNDLLVAALLAGIFAGFGSGLVFRYGATTGGGDIIGRLVEEKTGRQLGQTLLIIDAFVLTASLTYIDLTHMVYTLIASFVFSHVLTMVEKGGYSVRGMIIISQHYETIAGQILNEINRGVTYLNGSGAYSGKEVKVLYVVLNPTEVMVVKDLIADIDRDAFISVMNVDEVISSDFKIRRKNFDKDNG